LLTSCRFRVSIRVIFGGLAARPASETSAAKNTKNVHQVRQVESAFVKKDTQAKWIRDRSLRDRDLVYENFTLYYYLNAVVCCGRRLRAGEARDHHRSLQHRSGSHEYHKTCPRLRRCRLSSLPSTRSHGDSSLATHGVMLLGTPHQGSKMAGFIDCITQAGIAYDPTLSTPRGGSFGPTSTNSSSSSVKATAFGASMQGNRKQQERNWSLVDPFQSTNFSPTTDPHTRPQREALLDVTNTWKSRTLKLLLSLLG
jgi:hypothetical protein